MIDPQIIRSKYAGMSDSELVLFAEEEGNSLTEEAFRILQKEFESRKLDTSLLQAIANGTYLQYREAISGIENTEAKDFPRTVLAHALNEKRDGASDEAIVYSLMDMGMEEINARLLVAQLERHARKRLAAANTSMLAGSFVAVAGIALNMISPKKIVVTFTDILSICAIIFGVIWFFKSRFDSDKYRTVIRNIEQ